MNRRQQQKAETRRRLLDAAAARLRVGGAQETAVADVMADAGLTHGGFYSYFADKGELLDAAFHHAMGASREAFFGGLDGTEGAARLRWLAGRYLSTRHRDRPHEGCALASLAGDAARPDSQMGARFETELLQSLTRLSEGLEHADAGSGVDDTAIAFMALCIGGLLTARAVDDPVLSERVLRACRQLAPRLAAADNALAEQNNEARGVARRAEEETR